MVDGNSISQPCIMLIDCGTVILFIAFIMSGYYVPISIIIDNDHPKFPG